MLQRDLAFQFNFSKMLFDDSERSHPDACAQLERRWSAWLEKKYPHAAVSDADGVPLHRAATPTEEDTALAIEALAAPPRSGQLR